MPKANLSVFIITKDEENNIGRCLESAKWVDEIIIVDSFSADNTIEICRRYTDKIYQRKFTDFADMKNYALSETSNEWVLNLDADEEISSELRDEIKKVLVEDKSFSGFYIKRRSMIFGRWFKFCGTQKDYQMRLFKGEKAHYMQPVHEIVEVDGKTISLKSELFHYTYNNISNYIERLNIYTTMEAEFLKNKISRSKVLILILIKPFFRFINLYIVQQGFRDGIEGFLFSFLSAVYVFIKYSKALLER